MELGVRVCRSAGYYDHALALAAKHKLHHHHLAILIDDKKDYVAALRCVHYIDRARYVYMWIHIQTVEIDTIMIIIFLMCFKSNRYIKTLDFEEAKSSVMRYGSVLLNHVADETTELLIRLCTDYKPSNTPLIKEVSSVVGHLKMQP